MLRYVHQLVANLVFMLLWPEQVAFIRVFESLIQKQHSGKSEPRQLNYWADNQDTDMKNAINVCKAEV